MSDALVAEGTPRIPLRRVGEPAEIADVVVFLASAQARWVRGQVVRRPVDTHCEGRPVGPRRAPLADPPGRLADPAA
ncbi:SDR family oxidoreductase [Streptomyces buecherae]|uniref:SDR family oxidoreductase n=1 Tax=Streptomyces buecherae TaxID=2763006 RepID=UPI0036AA576D